MNNAQTDTKKTRSKLIQSLANVELLGVRDIPMMFSIAMFFSIFLHLFLFSGSWISLFVFASISTVSSYVANYSTKAFAKHLLSKQKTMEVK
jgi:hypothetical protein